MSNSKIKSKDLSYDASLPPFLQRLKNQHAGLGDRHERAIARPKRARDTNDEDEPTVVDENGETISNKELAERTAAATTEAELSSNNATTGESASDGAAELFRRPDAQVTDGKASHKRKAVKIVGEDDGTAVDSHVDQISENKPAKKMKMKKKSQAIKLAFEDEDG